MESDKPSISMHTSTTNPWENEPIVSPLPNYDQGVIIGTFSSKQLKPSLFLEMRSFNANKAPNKADLSGHHLFDFQYSGKPSVQRCFLSRWSFVNLSLRMKRTVFVPIIFPYVHSGTR